MDRLGLFSRTDHKARGESSQCLLSCYFTVIVASAYGNLYVQAQTITFLCEGHSTFHLPESAERQERVE